MKNSYLNIITLCVALFFTQNTFSQDTRKYIEVIGTAEKMIEGDILTYYLDIDPLAKVKDEPSLPLVEPVIEKKVVEKAVVNTDKKSKKKNKGKKEEEEENYEEEYDYDYHYDDYTEDVEEEMTLDDLKEMVAPVLGVNKDAISSFKMGPETAYMGTQNKIKITINKSEKDYFEDKLRKAETFKIKEWHIFDRRISPETQIEGEKQLLAKAIEVASSKAKVIATGQKLTLGQVLSIEEVDKSPNMIEETLGENFSQMFRGVMSMMGSGNETTVKLNLKVKVKFEIK